MRFQSLGQEEPLEKGKAAHCSIVAWRCPWTEKPGELLSIGSERVECYIGQERKSGNGYFLVKLH